MTTSTRSLAGWLGAVIVALAAWSAPCAAVAASSDAVSAQECPALLKKSFRRLQDESPQNLCQYRGKVLLVVNTASYCGFTSQYEGLEKLFAEQSSRGLVILGFPSNDFGRQEPGSSKEIADFCYNTYGVKFPMFEKSSVTGPAANALFKDLTAATGKAPQWNFHKYLIGRNGEVLASYPSSTEPSDARLVSDLQRALATP